MPSPAASPERQSAEIDREKIEAAVERLDFVTASLVNLIMLSDAVHVESLRKSLPEIVQELREGLGIAEGEEA